MCAEAGIEGGQMKKMFVAALTCTALVAPGYSSAHVVGKNDPNDVSGRLDVRRFGMEHGNKILLGVKFDQSVNKGDFAQGNSAGFNLEINGDAVPDRKVTIKRKKGKLKCTVFKTENDNRVGSVSADLNGAKVECELPERLLSRKPKALNAFSFYNDAQDLTDILEH